MTLWRHNICAACWNLQHPDHSTVTLHGIEEDICCFCGNRNSDGIYTRADGRTLPCKGQCDYSPQQ